MANTTDPIILEGENVALRVWRDEEPTANKPEETRSYETLGYIVAGALELTLAGKTVTLKAGDTYIVPRNTAHRYVVRERLTAVEAISPRP